MRNVWFFLFFMLLLTPAFGQRAEQDMSIEVSTKSLEKANGKVQRELGRLSRKLRRRVTDLYPELPADKVDSIVSAMSAKKETLEVEARDSASNYLQTLKEDLIQDLKETPEKLPIADEIRESIAQIDELNGMQGVLRDKEQLVDMLDVSELKQLNSKVGVLKSSFEDYRAQFEGWEDTLLEKIINLPQAQLAKEQVERMRAYKPLPEGYRDNLEQFQTNGFVKEQLRAKAEELKSIGSTTLQEKFDQAQTRITEAKEEFPSLESVEEAPKRYNPYRGQPFFKRLVLGGNLQVNRDQPASFDAAINLTYPLTKRSAIGVAAASRLFVEKVKTTQTKDNATSLRGFMRHFIFKSFYLQGNYELSKLQREDSNEINLGEQWVQTALLGLGRQVALSPKIQMSFTLFYDFFFDATTSPNNQAWVMRVGFGLSRDK